MVYINGDGTTSDTPKKKKWGLSLLTDFVAGVFDFVGIFFRTLTSNPATLQSERGQRRTTYAERQGVRRGGGGGGGANIRGVSRLGTARAAAGG